MVARIHDDKDARQKPDRSDKEEATRKRRDLSLEHERELQKDLLVDQLDELSVDFADNPEQIGLYLADLEAAGMLSPADKEMLFARLWETMGPAFADKVFGMTERALASGEDIAGDIAADAFDDAFFQKGGVVETPDELRRVNVAATALEALARMLGIRIDMPRPVLRQRFDDSRIADGDPERAEKTREILDTLGPQLGVDAAGIDVHVDDEGQAKTADQGIYGLMTEGSIFLDPDVYDPETAEGRGLLAHEVVHVAQLENRLSGANQKPSIAEAEVEADTLSSMFAEGGQVEAPLAALASYDKAACGPREMATPTDTPKKKEARTETIVELPTYKIVENKIALPQIQFKVRKWKLSETLPEPDAKKTLEVVANTLEAYPEITKISIEGFTSTTWDKKNNQVLSENRANEMKKELVSAHSAKVAKVGMEVKGWGEEPSKLAVQTKDNVEEKRNRRTEFHITEVNGAKAPDNWQPTKKVLVTPGKTIVRYIGPDGKVIKEEVIKSGEEAKTAPGAGPSTTSGATAKTPATGAADTPGGATAKKKEPTPADPATGGGDKGSSDAASSKEPASDAGGTTDPDAANDPDGASSKDEGREEKDLGARASRRRKHRNAKKAAKIQPFRFAGARRRVGQAKANVGGLTSTEIAEATQAPGGGEPIPDGARKKMEGAFGQDFGDVRIHRGSVQASSIGASAFARGTDIHFAPGRFDTDSAQGMATLGHELTHIVQQRAGRVSVPQGMGTQVNVERTLEAEADHLGGRAALGESVSVEGSSAALYSRAERGGADTILFEGGGGGGGAAPQQAEVYLAGQKISANMPSGASPGKVTVDFSSAASVAGLTLGQAELEFSPTWEIVRGHIKASVAIGEYVRANDIRMEVTQVNVGGTKRAEISATIRDADFNIPGLFNAKINLTITTTGITGEANITVPTNPVTLGQGITLQSGTLRVALTEGGVTASGRLLGTIAGLGNVTVTAEGMPGGKLSGQIELNLSQPLAIPGVEGVTIKSGSIRGAYTHKEQWQVSGNMVVNVRNWVEANISAKYTKTADAGGGGGPVAPTWELVGTLRQLQPYALGAGERLNLSNGELGFDFKNGEFLKTDVKVDYESTNWKGKVTGTFDVPKQEVSATGSIELKPPELPLGANGIKLTKVKAAVTIEKNVPKQFIGEATVVFPYEGQPTFKLEGQATVLIAENKVKQATAKVTTIRDIKLGDQAGYNVNVKTGATGTLDIADNKLVGITGGLNFDVNFAAGKIGEGKIDVKFNGTSDKVNGEAKFTITSEAGIGVPDRVAGPVMLQKGGEFSVKVEENALKSATVKNVKYEVRQTGEGATGKLAGEINGTYDFQLNKLTATGNGTITADWTLAPADGISIVFTKGGKIDVAVAESKLTKVTGDFPYKLTVAAQGPIPELKVDGKLTGNYSEETKKFSGDLTGELKNNADIPMGEARQDKLQLKVGAKFKAAVKDSKPDYFEIAIDADYHRAGKLFLSGHVDNAKYAFKTGEFDFKGEFTLKQDVEKATDDGKWKFIVKANTKVGVEVEKSKVKLLTGTMPFEIHDSALLAKGNLTDAKIDVEKLLFNGKLALTLGRDLQYPRTPAGGEAPPEGSPPVAIIAKKDTTSISATVTDNALSEVKAKCQFDVTLGGVQYGQGEVSGDLDMKQFVFDGGGKINLIKDLMLGGVERTPGGDPLQTWVLAFPAGQGLDIKIAKNQLDEADINLSCKLFNNADEVANGSVTGKYKLGKTDGFNGKVEANVIKNLDWSNEGRWHYWIEKGTKFKAVMDKTKVTSVDGNFSLLMQENPEGGRDAVRVKVDGAYTPGTGFNAKGDITALNDIKVGGGTEFALFVAKDSAGKAEVVGKKVTKLNGDLTLNVKKGPELFAKGVFKLDYDASNADAKVDATGKVDLLVKTEVGATGDWKFFILTGTGIDFSVLQNELQYIKGQLNAAAAFKGQECITGNVNVLYTHAGAKKFDADGQITVTQDILVGQLMSGAYKIDVKPGTGATFDVKNNDLKTIGGNVKIEVRDTAPLLGVDLAGTYTHAGTKFDGTGKVKLLRTIEVGKSPDGEYKFNILEGTGADATIADNKVTELKGAMKANVEREGEFAKIEGTVNARKTDEQWKITTVGANFTTIQDKQLPLKSPEWKVTILAGTGAKVSVTDNKLDEISGTIKVKIEKGADFAAQAELKGKYTPTDGFSGEATGKLLLDFKVGTSAPYSFWALKDGTEAKFTMLNSAVDKIGGKVNFKVDENNDKFIKGSASIDYDLKNNNLIEAKGDGVLEKEKTLGTYSGFTLVAVVGSKANFLAQQNELKKIGGELTLRVDEGGSALADGKVTADFDVKSGNFSGEGNVKLVRDYAVSVEGKNGKGQPESWGLCLKKDGGLAVKVKDNVFVEAQVDVAAVGYHNGKAKADGKVTGNYKAGDPNGFTGSIELKVTERVPLLEGSGRFDYHIDKDTNLNGKVDKGSIVQAGVTAILVVTEQSKDKIKATGTAKYAKGAGVDGGLTVLVVDDILIKEASAWKIWLAKDSGGNAKFAKSALESIDGTVKLRVDKGAEKFAVGDFTAKYDVKDGTNAKVTATGKVTLVAKVDVTPGAGGDFKVFLTAGTGIDAAVKDSELDFVSGQIKGELHYKGQHTANFDINGKYQSLGTPDFSGTGTLETVKEIDVIEYKGYLLKLGKGASISGSVKAFALDTLTANIPLELHKSSKKIVEAKLAGTYKHAEKKFDGTGSANVVETITVAENVGSKGYSFFLEKGGTSITAKVEANDLKELTGNLEVTVSDTKGKFLKATATATYKAGDPAGTVSGNGKLEVTRDTDLLTTTNGYVAVLKKGSNATIDVKENKLNEIGGEINVELQKPAGTAFAKVALKGTYKEEGGFNGTGEAELCVDYKIIETKIGADTYSLWAMKGTGAKITLANSDITKVGGKVNAMIRDAEDASGDFIKITAEADYDFPGKVFNGKGGGEVLKDKKLATFNSEELWLAKGTGINGTISNNNLQQVGGKITLKLKDAQGFYLEGELAGTFDAAGGSGFSGKASIKVTRDKKLGEIGNYKFFLSAEGGATGASATIEKNELTKVTGNVPFKVYDEKSEPLIKGQAEGTYEAKTQEFSGKGSIYLARKVEYDLAGGKLIFLAGSGGGGEVVKNKLEKLTGILKVDIHDSKGPMVHAEADGEFNAVTKTIERLHGHASLLRPITVGNPPAVKINELSGDVWIEKNEVKKIEGTLSVELPALSKNGAKASGTFKGGWEKTAAKDEFWGSGEIDFTVFDKGDRYLKGKVKGEYKRDTKFEFAGKLTYQMNPNMKFEVRVAVDQNIDPVIGATASIDGIKLAAARDLFKWDKDFKLLNVQAMAGPVPINFAGGVGVGIGLALKQTNMGASINFDGWRPLSAPGDVPNFTAELRITSGLVFKAFVSPWLTFGIGVGGLVSAGVGLKGKGTVTVDVGVNPTGRIWGVSGKYGGELDLGLKLVGSGDLSLSPLAYAELPGKKWDYEIAKITHQLGELFSFGYNFKFPFGDQAGAPTKGGAADKSVPAAGSTTETAAAKEAPPKDPATVGGLNQPAAEKGQPDMNSAKGDKKADDPMAGIMEKIDRVQKTAASIGRIASALGVIIDALDWAIKIPLPFGLVFAAGYLAYKHYSGECDFNQVWKDIQDIWKLVEESGGIRKIMPDWLVNLYDKVKGRSLSDILGDAVTAIVGMIKDALPDWAGSAIDALGDVMRGAGSTMVKIFKAVKNGISGGISGVKTFAKMLVELGGEAASIGARMLKDAVVAVGEAAWDAVPW